MFKIGGVREDILPFCVCLFVFGLCWVLFRFLFMCVRACVRVCVRERERERERESDTEKKKKKTVETS